MTMVELQSVLSKALTDVMDTESTPEEQTKALARAEAASRIAKQMINNADVVLRTDKLTNRHDRIDQVVG